MAQTAGCLGFDQQVLTPEAQGDPAVDVLGARVREADPHQRGGVVVGLQQTGYVLGFVEADDGGFALQAHVRAEPLRQHVSELVPPAGLVGLAGQGEEALDLGAGDPVGPQQLLHIGDTEADLGLLHAADGQGGDLDGAGGIVEGHSGLLPQLAEPFAEDHAQDRGRRRSAPS